MISMYRTRNALNFSPLPIHKPLCPDRIVPLKAVSFPVQVYNDVNLKGETVVDLKIPVSSKLPKSTACNLAGNSRRVPIMITVNGNVPILLWKQCISSNNVEFSTIVQRSKGIISEPILSDSEATGEITCGDNLGQVLPLFHFFSLFSYGRIMVTAMVKKEKEKKKRKKKRKKEYVKLFSKQEKGSCLLSVLNVWCDKEIQCQYVLHI